MHRLNTDFLKLAVLSALSAPLLAGGAAAQSTPDWNRAIGPFGATASFAGAASAAPGVGDLAPDWTLPGSDGKQYTLSQMRGKHVVIAFFPKAFTGG